MATRSYICIKLSDEKKALLNTNKDYVGVYCHWDGYVMNGVGEMLLDCYNSAFRAFRLINHGEIQALGDCIKNTSFYTKKPKKEDFVFFNKEEIDKVMGCMICYVYIFEDGAWHYYRTCGRGKGKWRCFGAIKDMAYFKKRTNNKK